jgi:hypothetical protein
MARLTGDLLDLAIIFSVAGTVAPSPTQQLVLTAVVAAVAASARARTIAPPG